MDQGAKTLGQMIILFMSIFLMIGVICFFLVAANARSAAYSIVEYIEIRGYDSEAATVINDYASSHNISVTVAPVDETIHVVGESEVKNRYRVDVSFNHVFAVLNFGKTSTFTLYTRAVDY